MIPRASAGFRWPLADVLDGSVSRSVHSLLRLFQSSHQSAAAVRTIAGAAVEDEGFGPYTKRQVEDVVDRAAIFNLHLGPSAAGSGGASRSLGSPVHGFLTRGMLAGLDIDLAPTTRSAGVRAHNMVSGPAGHHTAEWLIVPEDHIAFPDRRPPATPLDPTRSQRVVLQHLECSFGEGSDAFIAFGAGRTMPTFVAGELRLAVAAVGEVISASGKLAGHEGNLTLAGEITPTNDFVGHVVLRMVDLDGTLRSSSLAAPVRKPLELGATYLAFLGQKGEGPEQKNTLSFTRDGRLRGGNVATELHRGQVSFTVDGPGGLTASDLESGPIIGREIGFGSIDPQLAPAGTPRSPFPFDGVAQYDFFDERGEIVGGITTNVVEGRRIDIDLGLVDQPTYRFGFFGPIVAGSGCFEGVTGIFYGASGSVFNIPPAGQVVTHFYAARLDDPDGRFRAITGNRRGVSNV